MITPPEKKPMPAPLQALDKGLEAVTSACLILSALLLGLLAFFYVFEVIVRYFFDSPTSWTFDLGKSILCTSMVLALPDITRSQGNITIDAFLERLSPQTRKGVKRIISLIAFPVCLITAWICLGETIRQFEMGVETFWINPIPKWWISAFIPFGITLSSLHFLKLGVRRSDPI